MPHTGKAVLVVDDDPMILRLLETAFSKAGYRVLPSLDGEFGLRVAKEALPSVVVLDLMMPRVDGWTFITGMNQDPKLNGTPVVIITAHWEEGIEARAAAAGAFAIMRKPLNMTDLINVVARALHASEKRQAAAQ